MTLYFITGNKNKFEEIKKVLGSDIEIEILDIDLPEIQEIDAKKIIEHKLKEAMKHKKGSFIVEDTSLYFEGMNGLPGPLIKWFLSSLGNDGLCKLSESFGKKVEARTIIGYASKSSSSEDIVRFFEGSMNGEIVTPTINNDFGWGPIFKPDCSEKSFGEMTREEKNELSMRAVAAKKLKEYLTKIDK